MPDDELETVAYAKYEWDCPECSEVNEEESDPAGDTLECGDCHASVRIRETR